MKRILFVCLGNICRSPIAEGVASHIAKKRGLQIEVDSAGTSSWHAGEHPCEHSVKVSKQHGIDIASLTSRPVSEKDKLHFDYIIAMDSQNRNDLETMGFQNVHLLGDFGGHEGKDVPDPYFFPGFEGFEKVYTMIETAIEDFIEKVKHESI
ncbi:MAG: low molecular weight phosphotyrosine protein phosphatase [Sulfurovum sp.]|nr:low molecular weight phosphotyrosine protein phosphatase [Sulfurovum sp.]